MSMLRRSRRNAVILIAGVAAAGAILFAGLASTGTGFGSGLGMRAATFAAALGIAAIIIMFLQELTDRIEHH